MMVSRAFRKYSYYLLSIVQLLTGFRNPGQVVRLFLKAAPSGSQEVRLRQGSVRFLVRGPMDVWIIKETWLDRFYERYGTPIGEGWTVMDVGAGVGDFALYAAMRRPNCLVYAFEPFPESFELLRENLRRNGVENVRAFPEALAARTGRAVLDTSAGEPLQFGTAAPDTAQGLSVPALSLADALERAGGRCDLMKMDCEGAEYGILYNAPDASLRQVRRIVMEYHESSPPHTRSDLVAFLTGKGFYVQTHPNPVHTHLGFLYAWQQREI